MFLGVLVFVVQQTAIIDRMDVVIIRLVAAIFGDRIVAVNVKDSSKNGENKSYHLKTFLIISTSTM
jgi:hypothetical protein